MSGDWTALLALGARFGRVLLIGAAAGWLCALGLLWLLQRHILYMAPREPPGPPPPGYRSVLLKTEDGLALTAWYRAPAPGRPTLLFFPAQGARLSWSAEWSEALADAGFGLLLLSYRGFDGNPGSPSEQGLYRDGRAALAWLAAEGENRPVLLGLSLGTGVAAELAAEAAAAGQVWPKGCRPRALILLSPYESIPAVGARRYTIFPVRLLARDRFDTLAKIGRARMPVLVAHGEDDRVIPYSQGVAVFRAAPEPKRFVDLPSVGHDYSSADVLSAVEAFVDRH